MTRRSFIARTLATAAGLFVTPKVAKAAAPSVEQVSLGFSGVAPTGTPPVIYMQDLRLEYATVQRFDGEKRITTAEFECCLRLT